MDNKGFPFLLIIVGFFILIGGILVGHYLGKNNIFIADILTLPAIGPRSVTQVPPLEPPPYPPPSLTPEEQESEIQKTKLKSQKDLAVIISTVVDYALKNGQDNPIVSVWKNDGTFASGNLGNVGAGGGAGWWAAKINDNWTVVYVGQSPPECSEIAEYNLPKSFLNCYNP